MRGIIRKSRWGIDGKAVNRRGISADINYDAVIVCPEGAVTITKNDDPGTSR